VFGGSRTFGNKMTLKVHRPHCRYPVLGTGINFLLGLALVAVTNLLNLPPAVYGLAAIFGACGILFLVLAVTAPGTTILIDSTKISISGSLLGGSLYFNEIASATVAPDPDAQNYQQVSIESHDGRTLLMDARFLNPDTDGLMNCLRERLQQHGIPFLTKRYPAEQREGGKASPSTS